MERAWQSNNNNLVMNGSRDIKTSLLDIGDLAYLATWEMKLMPLRAKFSPVTESEGGGGR